MSDKLLWIAVPGGKVENGQVPLRLLIVPRLAGPLQDGPLHDWPATLATRTFEVDLRVGQTITTVAPQVVSQSQPEVWHAFFGDGVQVRPYQARTYAGTTVDPTSEHAAKIVQAYEATAKAPETAGTQLAQFAGEVPPTAPAPPTPDGQEPDFHRIVAMLREHPTVLRALGLIVELTVPASALQPAGFVRVGSPGLDLIRPWTSYEFDGTHVLPASAGDVSSGMLDLSGTDLSGAESDSSWEITTFDVDGGLSRLREAADSDRSSLPHLRSAGLMLVRRGRQQDFDARHQTAKDNAQFPELLDFKEFAADELILGYRIDIRPKDGQWSGLCRRVASYDIGDVAIGTPKQVEEGQVKPYAAVGGGDGVLRADEVVARWDGWSLAVPRKRPAEQGAGFTWSFDVEPGSLPELRFGHSYEVRARVADLAGGGIGLDDAAAGRFVSSLVAYTRYEPVPPPETTVTELVIRSDRGMTVAEFLAANPRYAAEQPRLQLEAPSTSLSLAEQHGMLDGADPETFLAAQRPTDPAAEGVAVHLPGRATERRPWTGTWPDREQKTFELAERPPGGGGPLAEWDETGMTATARLAQGEQVTAELSSYLPDDFLDRFSIRRWLEPGAESQASGGRHPMVTPPHAVNLVHAVRKPLRDPAGTLKASREEGQTWTRLLPEPALLGLDANSTVQLRVEAAWDEWSDSPTPAPAVAKVQTLPLQAADVALGELRQEFGDTKHRMVTYTLTADSRFRRHFADDEPPEAFIATAKLAPVVVPSSAKPVPPVVLGVRPAFRWTGAAQGGAEWDSLERTRLSGRLRVELDRPWFTTGAGERLAVLRARFGRDPIWATLEPPAAIEQMSTHAVEFDGAHWYADVPMPPTQSYAPFVRLTVARHQPNSLPGLELSTPVDTELVQVLPDRTLTVQRHDGNLHILLRGTGPDGPRPNRVEALLEQGTQGTTTLTALDPDDVPAWVRVPGHAVSGTLNAELPPLAIPQVDGLLRVYVREIEQIDTAPGDGELFERVVFADFVHGFSVQ
ncbi:hypothetical protein [Nonomuraea sediminis]|uniref:hypothetical protein n=1 Tax=Nonomuraea sediminis TaxID=2835864 RepID=UPI001BDDC4BA|nr:hypothetical protein [Nonomuraea sediminis]